MKKLAWGLAMLMALATTAVAAEDRWLHVRVKAQGPRGESVMVNVPLSLAEKVLPSIHSHEMRGGKVTLHDADLNGVDLRAILEAMRDVGDNEFVRVESPDENVRVAKEGDYMVIHVRDHHGKSENVDVKVPMKVVDAMLTGRPDELDLVAGLRALSAYGDTPLVTVEDGDETVRIWVDSKNVTE